MGQTLTNGTTACHQTRDHILGRIYSKTLQPLVNNYYPARDFDWFEEMLINPVRYVSLLTAVERM
jgi:hypothetical protein